MQSRRTHFNLPVRIKPRGENCHPSCPPIHIKRNKRKNFSKLSSSYCFLFALWLSLVSHSSPMQTVSDIDDRSNDFDDDKTMTIFFAPCYSSVGRFHETEEISTFFLMLSKLKIPLSDLRNNFRCS